MFRAYYPEILLRMKSLLPALLVFAALGTGLAGCNISPYHGLSDARYFKLQQLAQTAYPDTETRVPSPGHLTYFVDPVNGDDKHWGVESAKAWKSFAKINALKLAPGDRVVVAPGVHTATLAPAAQGTAAEPVVIEFLSGVHAFESAGALARPWFVSNTADRWDIPKPCGILVEGSRHVRFTGAGAAGKDASFVRMEGPARMVKVIVSESEDVAFEKIAFDLKRPSVSEITVLETGKDASVVRVAQGSTYEIRDGKFAWTGDLGHGWVMAQVADLETRKARRLDRWNPFAASVATDLGDGRIRLTHTKGNPGLVAGRSYGFRHILHDSLSFHLTRSKEVVFRDCRVHAMTNMSFVSQFTDGVTFQRVDVVPPEGSGRTCPSSMDVFHFANCRGKVLVDSCRVSGAGDDGMNCHGVHLGILDAPAANRLRVRYRQGQTFGFQPYIAGDEIAVIDHRTLCEKVGNPRRKVTAVEPVPGDPARKEWLLTLDGPVPAFAKGDVVDNVSWYPEVTVRNCLFELASCRGILVTTRGKTLIEGNTINSTMPGVLIEDDANFWWESGPVRDLTIRNNTFLNCGIAIEPQVLAPDGAVHEDILITNNRFVGEATANHYRGKTPFVVVKDVKGLTVTGNKFDTPEKDSVKTERCTEVKVEGNEGK